MNEQEIWKDILVNNNKYKVSSLWRIYSYPKYWRWWHLWKYLKWSNILWYIHIQTFINNKRKKIKLHRLIAQAFIPNPENKPCINHKNGIRNDNRVENLEWVTSRENTLHSYYKLWNKSIFCTNNPNKWKLWILNHNSKKIKQYDLNWNFIKIWYWWTEIYNILWINKSNICLCYNWKRKTAWWFIWKI